MTLAQVVYLNCTMSYRCSLAPRYVLTILLLLSPTVRSGCYDPTGAFISEDTPCNPKATDSICCGPDSRCLANGICTPTKGDPDLVTRGTCTDSTYTSASCAQYSLHPNAAPHGNVMYHCYSPANSTKDSHSLYVHGHTAGSCTDPDQEFWDIQGNQQLLSDNNPVVNKATRVVIKGGATSISSSTATSDSGSTSTTSASAASSSSSSSSSSSTSPTSSPTSTQSSATDSSSSSSYRGPPGGTPPFAVRAIIGIAIAGVVVLFLCLAALCYLIFRRRRTRKSREKFSTPVNPESGTDREINAQLHHPSATPSMIAPAPPYQDRSPPTPDQELTADRHRSRVLYPGLQPQMSQKTSAYSPSTTTTTTTAQDRQLAQQLGGAPPSALSQKLSTTPQTGPEPSAPIAQPGLSRLGELDGSGGHVPAGRYAEAPVYWLVEAPAGPVGKGVGSDRDGLYKPHL